MEEFQKLRAMWLGVENLTSDLNPNFKSIALSHSATPPPSIYLEGTWSSPNSVMILASTFHKSDYSIFSPYSVDRITIRGYDVGYVKGMAINRNSQGFGDNWKLDKVTMATGALTIYS